MSIRAITFDLWDTLVADDSDEAARARAGLLPKPEARHQAVRAALQARFPDVTDLEAAAAWQTSLDWFRHEWKVQHRTPDVASRIAVALDHLNKPTDTVFPDLVETLSAMEVLHPPDLAPGIEACLDRLSGQYRLGIISDAIMTPGIKLREILHKHGIAHHFELFVFSDEAGAAKPAPRVFQIACDAFDCRPDELVHIGDREANDIDGPLHFGSRAVLYTGVVDRGASNSRADAVCEHHDALPSLIAELSEQDT